MSTPDLSASLREVRRAWRIVAAYQRRVNELFYAVHEVVTTEGLDFSWWHPNHYQPPMAYHKVQFDPGKWAWDLLPGYCLSAQWADEGSKPRRLVWMALETDTAFVDAKARGGQPDPTAMGDLDAPGSRSELYVHLYTANGRVDWDQLWEKHLKAQANATDAKEIPWTYAGTTGGFRRFTVPLEALDSPEAVERLLLGPVRGWVAPAPTTA